MNIFNCYLKLDSDVVWRLMFAFCMTTFIITSADIAFAAGAGNANDVAVFSTALCRILALILGTPAKVIATIAMVGVAVALLAGRLEWTKAMVIALGIIIMFIAPALVKFITGNQEEFCPAAAA
jgi:type IV secretory pathway VirB2 component (pilin)